jgi:hypothetical protein
VARGLALGCRHAPRLQDVSLREARAAGPKPPSRLDCAPGPGSRPGSGRGRARPSAAASEAMRGPVPGSPADDLAGPARLRGFPCSGRFLFYGGEGDTAEAHAQPVAAPELTSQAPSEAEGQQHQIQGAGKPRNDQARRSRVGARLVPGPAPRSAPPGCLLSRISGYVAGRRYRCDCAASACGNDRHRSRRRRRLQAKAAPSRGPLCRAIGRDRPKGGAAKIIVRPLYPQLLPKLLPSIGTVKECQKLSCSLSGQRSAKRAMQGNEDCPS